MACATPSDLCATCKTLSAEQKPKQGILLCLGCQEHFCSQHIIQHRQHLTDLFVSEVVNKRNELQEKASTLYEQQWYADIQVQLETINKWELDTTELIKQSAEYARKQIQEMALKECDILKKQLSMLSDELNILHENENYFENDIKQLSNAFQQLKDNMERYPIEFSIKEIPQELIIVKSIVQTASQTAPSFSYIDQLLESQKPKLSFNLSAIKPGQMCPISDQLITFYSPNELPALNTSNHSWQSLHLTDDVLELHWSDFLQRFLVLKYSRSNEPNKLCQIDPQSAAHEMILKNSPLWNSGWCRNITTLTCFKQHVLIILKDRIEKWTTNHSEWHTDRQSTIRWCPPISCQSSQEIKCIRMNDLYYALMITKGYSESSPLYFELKSHGMSTLYRIITDYGSWPEEIRLFSLPNESGWLFFFCKKKRNHCYVFDNDGKRYDQNIVLSSNVTDIVIRNNLIILRKQEKSINYDVMEIYDW